MKGSRLSRYAITLGAASALLAGCGGSQPPIGAPGVMPQSRAMITRDEPSGSSQNTSSVPDGLGPSSRLVALSGKLYGTTGAGGAGNDGTVYRITSSGVEEVLHSFATGCRRRKKCSDGLNPTSLVSISGTLYGTTGRGGLGPCGNFHGPDGCGTVFSFKNGAETVLYSFTGGGCRHPRRCRDANYPNALAAIGGTLYGTSWYGGAYGLGTVFSVTTSGVEKVLHSFGRGGKGLGAEGGAYPNEALTDVDGTLYGTTAYGGAQGAGVVYGMSKTGRTKVLYSFDAPPGGGSAGSNGLININGVLYGTTSGGGPYHNEGTVYSITTDGTVNVLHSFGAGCPPRKRCSDGEYPDSGLLDVNGMLYGETAAGGTHASGTVFSITTSGSESVLRSFSQGYGPAEGLTAMNGILYGVTFGGSCDGGTVFSLTLSGKVKRLHTFC